MRVGDRTDFDKLSIEIETDGTLTPEEAFYEASDIILKHFNVISEGKNSATPAVEEIEEKKVKKATKKNAKKK